MKEHFEINIENLSNEEKADVLYYNIFLAIVSELKLDKYFCLWPLRLSLACLLFVF